MTNKYAFDEQDRPVRVSKKTQADAKIAGVPITFTPKQKMGKKSHAKGKEFERKVRVDLESKGWIVSKWQNNVEFKEYEPGEHQSGGVGLLGNIIPVKPKFNPFTKSLMMNSGGFPDFIAFNLAGTFKFNSEEKAYMVVGYECKTNGQLDKIEKQKCLWLLKNNIFSKIFIAKKSEKRGEIIYEEFK